MKRSQMLQIVKDALYCHMTCNDKHLTVIAECVLQSVEGGNKLGEGMLPPEIVYYTDIGNGNTRCHQVCEWDSE